MPRGTRGFSKFSFPAQKSKVDDGAPKKRGNDLLRAMPDAVPELAVAPRSSSITCDRGEKNVNVYGKTQRRGGRGARR